jgi:hypothetical protein
MVCRRWRRRAGSSKTVELTIDTRGVRTMEMKQKQDVHKDARREPESLGGPSGILDKCAMTISMEEWRSWICTLVGRSWDRQL